MRSALGVRTTGAPFSVAALVVATTVCACGLEQLTQGGSKGDAGAAAAASADAGAEAGVTGQACGVESGTGATLCRATSQCPSVAIDPQDLPHCGFRIKGGSAELVCACGESICSMGAYTTCAQAAQLLTSQTEQQVCAQIAEGRCTTGTSSTSSSSSGSSSGRPCDKQCMAECGGGSGCASVCGC